MWLILLPIIGTITFYCYRKKYTVHKKGIVLVTGASTGIGRHAVEHIAMKHDYLVLAGVRKEKDAVSIRSAGIRNLQPIIIDVTNHESTVRAVENIKALMAEKNLPFVGLVNNAGISRSVISEYHSLDDARAVFETNFFGVLDLTQQTLPLLRQSKGRIINISSVLGFLSVPKHGVYAASKHALEALSDAIRRETAHFGISVSVIEPSYVKTAIQDNMAAASKEVVSQTDVEQQMTTPALYGRFYTKEVEAKFQKELEAADGPDVTSAAIEKALTSAYPQTRYPVAHGAGMHATLIRWVVWLLSDRLADATLID